MVYKDSYIKHIGNHTILMFMMHTQGWPRLDANVHAARSAPKSETAADVTN